MERKIRRYESVAAVLPGHLRRAAMALSQEEKAAAEELRLRAGGELTVLLPDGERNCGIRVEQEDLETVCNLAAEFSRYAAMETLRQGFVTMKGGCRVGFCGTVVMKDGTPAALRDFSSAAVRIARERPGIADDLICRLFRDGQFQSTLILSPPGGGKTTLLRELVRKLSEGEAGIQPMRIGLADERGEIAVLRQGVAQMDVGPRTDVLDGCPKAAAIPMLLRCINPRVIAVDEITVREDLQAMAMAANCGVGLLATIHAADTEELMRKPLYAELLQAKVFRLAVILRRDNGVRRWELEELP